MTPEEDTEFNRRRRGRNLAMALLLAGFVILFFFITIARISAQ